MAVFAILLALTVGSALAGLPQPVYQGQISETFVHKTVQNADGSRLYQDVTSGRYSHVCRPRAGVDVYAVLQTLPPGSTVADLPLSVFQGKDGIILCESTTGHSDQICTVQPDRGSYNCRDIVGQDSISCRFQSAEGGLTFGCQVTGNTRYTGLSG